MALLTCCGGAFKSLGRAAAKAAASKFRRAGVLRVEPDWPRRAEICERCPLRVVRRGVSYCGEPFLENISREPHEGCGCPTLAKAKTPGGHCPLTRSYQAADESSCNCKWCSPSLAQRLGRSPTL